MTQKIFNIVFLFLHVLTLTLLFFVFRELREKDGAAVPTHEPASSGTAKPADLPAAPPPVALPGSGKPGPSEEESGTPPALHRIPAMPDGGKKNSPLLSSWKDLARSDPGKALAIVKTKLEAWRTNREGAPDTWMEVRQLLTWATLVGTEEAYGLVAEYMVLPDDEFDFAHRSKSFGEILADAPAAFSPIIGPAALKKLRAVVEAGDTSWAYVDGYSDLVGRHGGDEGKAYLKELFEGTSGDASPQLTHAAYRALCRTGDRSLLPYVFADPKRIRIALSGEREGILLFQLDREQAVAKLRTLVEKGSVYFHFREVAASVLGRGDEKASVPYFQSLYRGKDAVQRRLAVCGIGQVGRGDADDDLRRKALDLVTRALADQDQGVRRKAYYAVEYNDLFKTEAMAALLREKLYEETVGSLKRGARDALRETERFLKKKGKE